MTRKHGSESQVQVRVTGKNNDDERSPRQGTSAAYLRLDSESGFHPCFDGHGHPVLLHSFWESYIFPSQEACKGSHTSLLALFTSQEAIFSILVDLEMPKRCLA